MPALLNPRWERFCQLVACGLSDPTTGFTQAKAYKEAGYKAQGHGAETCASRMLKYVEPVAKRIQELQAENYKRKRPTVDSITKRLERASQIAEEDRIPNAIVAAETTKAKLYGLFVERTEQGKPGDFSSTNNSTELADRLISQCNPNVIPTDELRRAVLEIQRRSVEEIAFIVDAAAALEPGQPLPDPTSLTH